MNLNTSKGMQIFINMTHVSALIADERARTDLSAVASMECLEKMSIDEKTVRLTNLLNTLLYASVDQLLILSTVAKECPQGTSVFDWVCFYEH